MVVVKAVKAGELALVVATTVEVHSGEDVHRSNNDCGNNDSNNNSE